MIFLYLWHLELPVPPFCQACLLPMGLTSENVAAAYGIPRDHQDSMAADSHKKVGIWWKMPMKNGGIWWNIWWFNVNSSSEIEYIYIYNIHTYIIYIYIIIYIIRCVCIYIYHYMYICNYMYINNYMYMHVIICNYMCIHNYMYIIKLYIYMYI